MHVMSSQMVQVAEFRPTLTILTVFQESSRPSSRSYRFPHQERTVEERRGGIPIFGNGGLMSRES
jgi:hypothetical protein